MRAARSHFDKMITVCLDGKASGRWHGIYLRKSTRTEPKRAEEEIIRHSIDAVCSVWIASYVREISTS